MAEKFKVEPGDVVRYVDRHGKTHNALVVYVEGTKKFTPPESAPSINLVYVSPDYDSRLVSGHPLLHGFMVPHSCRQSGPVNYWRMPEEGKR